MSTLDDVLAKIDANQTDALARLFALLAIPSISADPAHFADCEAAADWLVRELLALGFDASKRATSSRPPADLRADLSRAQAVAAIPTIYPGTFSKAAKVRWVFASERVRSNALSSDFVASSGPPRASETSGSSARMSRNGRRRS